MGFWSDLFKSHEHCFHIVADSGTTRVSGNKRRCCVCGRQEILVSGPLEGHGPNISDPDNKVWAKEDSYGW